MKKVFVLGGTGLLGFATIEALLDRGYNVSAIARNEKIMSAVLPQEVVERHVGDMNEMTDQQILDMLKGKDMFVYASGLDERTLPKAPAVRFYYEQNVLPTQRMARLARTAGVKKFVIFGSYHTHSAEMWPDLHLKEQAYVRTRLLQEEVAFLEGEGAMDVMSLRLPYIFGTMPFRTPLWKSFIPRVQGKDMAYVPGGGTAMVTTKQVAEATVGALENGKHGRVYAISGINMKYEEFYQMIVDVLGQKDTVIKVAAVEQLKPSAEKMDEKAAAEGKEYAIHMAKQIEMQNRDAYIDPNDTMPVLKYNQDDVKKEIMETLKACIE